MIDRQFYAASDGRELTATEVDLLARVDALGEEARALLARLQTERQGHWAEIANARHAIQTGLMWLRRAIVHPSTF